MLGIQIICFESTLARDLYQERFSETSNSSQDKRFHYTLEEFVGELTSEPGATAESRLELLTAMLPEEEHSRAFAWLYTLEKLRESLILTHEDADFCFSVLPTTPRHELLLKMLHAYLDSSLKDDWTDKVWKLRDRLQEKTLAFEESTEVTFVQSSPSNFLFPELASTLRTALPQGKVSILPSWQFARNESEETSGVTFTHGPTTELVKALVEDAGNAQSILAIQASRASVSFLGSMLAKHGVSFKNWIPAGPSLQQMAPSAIAKEIARLRASELDTQTKLVWGQELLETHTRDLSLTAKSDWLTEWQKTHVIPASQHIAGATQSPSVHLIPLNLLPASLENTYVLVDDALFQPDREPLLLRENDLLRLEREGFTLPKLLDHRRQMTQIFDYIAKGNLSASVYSSYPEPEKLVSIPWIPLEVHGATEIVAEGPPTSGILLPSRRPLSATQLETYSKCPSQYLFSQVMRFRKKLSPQDQYALIFGQAAHSALENFFKEPNGRDQILRTPGEGKRRLMELFREALEKGENPVPATSSASLMWQEHFERLANRLPEMEEQLANVFLARRVAAVEKQFTLEVASQPVTGKIDRLDEREDGSLLVLDYKTGTIDFTPDHISKGTHFQALLYILGAEKELGRPVAGMLFYDLKKGELKRGILREESFAKEVKKSVTRGHLLPAVKWESVIGEGRNNLETYAAQIGAGEFTAAPSAKNCQFCDFVTLCRKAVGYA